MKKIIIPKEELKCVCIEINKNTFLPEPRIIINKDYINKNCKNSFIKNVYVDNSYFEKWTNDTKTTTYEELLNYKLEIGTFEGTNRSGIDNNFDYVIDNMYDFSKGYVFPVVVEIDDMVENNPEKIYSVRDATKELATRYIEILTPIRDLDRHLNPQKTSNNHLMNMLSTILENDTLPEDKISRWIGFIQGVLIMKGYVSVSTEHNVARPLFHKVYESNGIKIPKSKDL